MREPKGVKVRLCLRCGRRWLPRKLRYPRECPRCKSTLWDAAPVAPAEAAPTTSG